MKLYVKTLSDESKVIEVTKGKLTKVAVSDGSKYQFIDDIKTKSKKNKLLKTKRVGDDLEVYFEGDTEPSLILENYFVQMQTPPMIYNENGELLTESGFINLTSDIDPFFLLTTSDTGLLYGGLAVVAGGGIIALASNGGGSSNPTDPTDPTDVTPPSLNTNTGVTSTGTPTDGINIVTTLPSNVVVGDKVTTVLKDSNGTVLQTLETVVTANDIQTGTITQVIGVLPFGTYTTSTSMVDAAGNVSGIAEILFNNNLSGQLQDDYIADAFVFIDSNNNGIWDEGEEWTQTDSEGKFEFTTNPNGAPIVAMGGVDTASGTPNTISYKMYLDATTQQVGGDVIMSPLSTLIAAIADAQAQANGNQEITQESLIAAVNTIGQVFGIDIQDPVAILNYDFVASSTGENATAFDKDFLSLNRQIAVVLSTTTALIDGAAATTNSDVDANILGKGTLAVTQSIANLILEKSSSESTMDLTSSSDIKTIIENSMIISNESELTSDLRASNEADLTTLSDVIAGFNTKIDEQTNLDPQSDDAKATIRTVTEILIPILTTSGSQAQTERGGDISLSDSLTGLTTDASGDVNSYIDTQIETVKTENKPFLANDVEGIAGQLTKIVLQMPTLGVGDSVDKLYISKETNGNLSVQLFTVNPLTKETNELTQEIEIDGRTYLVIDPSVVGFLYVKSSAIPLDYLDVIAYNTVSNVETRYDGDVKISMTDPLILPTISITNMEDNAPAITGTISKNGVTNDSTPTMSGTLSDTIPNGYTLKVFNNDGNLVDVTSLNGLNWSYTSTELIDGNQALSIAIVRDSDSKIMYALNPYGFIVDTATTTPIINQTDGKVINGTAEIGSTVTIKAGLTVIGTAMTDSNGKWSLTVSSQVADETSLTATAVDRAGNSATSSSVTVQWGVPTTLVTITSVIDDLKTLTDNSYTSDSTPTISGTLSALLKENEVLSIFNGGTKIGEAIVTGQTWTFTPTTPLIDGTYPLSAKVDNGAEQGVTSSVFTLNIDMVAPTQTIEITSVMDDISGITGDIFDTHLTNDSKPTFNGTISSGLNSNESIVAYIATTKVGVATVTGTNWTFTPSTALSDGLKNIKFVVEDKSGLKSAITSFEFTIDTVAPSSIVIDSNSLITSIQEGDTETIICSVTATNGATLSMKSGSGDSDLFEVSSDGKVTAKIGLDYESKTTYTFTVIASDEAGNFKEVTATISVTDATEAPTILSVEPSSLLNYETPVEGETVEVSFIVKRTDSSGVVTVSWETSGISAQDFEGDELPSGEVTFANGETNKTVTILVPASLTQEQLRTLEISLVDASEGYYIDETNSSSTADIVDSSSVETGTRFTVLADNSVISEGAEGETRDITYTITRSGDLSQSLTISYSVTPSGAALVSGDDFGLSNLPTDNIIFEAGSATATVTISVQGDNDVGPDEQFNFLLGNLPDNSKVFGNTIGKIVNDDAYISVIPQEIVGATTGEVTHKFIIIRTGDTSTSHSVTYTISSTGENGTDLFNTDEPVIITFEEGETQKEISFQTTGDEVINGYKSFGIELSVSEDSNVTLLNKVAISTINPNVQDVKIEADIDRLLEGSSEEFVYTVTRSGNISEALEIPWSLEPSNENGVNANDFINNTYPSGTLVFAQGETTATIQFKSRQDTILEGDQGFNIVLNNSSLPEYIRLINPSIEGFIVDDESAVGFANDAHFEAIEGDNGTTDLVITVTRVGFTGNPSTVDWALSFGNEGNSAVLSDLMQGQDTTGTVTFRPGEATATITIKVAGDVNFENGLDEVFNVTLSNPSAGTKLIGGTGENGVVFDGYSNVTTATIINDDSLIKVESSTVDYMEGQGGTSDYVAITILREGSTQGSDWVKWSLISNGESNSADNTDLGQENDYIGIFDSYYDSWIDFATLSGNQNSQGSITLSKDGYIMISYNRDWSYDYNTTPIDEFILNNLSVNGGILTSVEDSSYFDLQYEENTTTASGSSNDDGENYDYRAYVIFKLDVTDVNAEISFDMEQLGRYGIDTSAISYAPQGTFSVNKDDMIYENEGANLLIPALKSPLLINILDKNAFTDEGNYSIDSVNHFYISSVYSDNLYFNEGTQENPNWVYFWDHANNVESYDISIEDINNGKLGYTGNTVELYIYAYDEEYTELGSTTIFTGVYTTLSIDDFLGDYDLNSAEYVYFDSIPSENFYINTSETSTPNWVNVYDNEGYVSVQDIIEGKLAYLGNSKDFEAYIYDENENELSFIENVEYHTLSIEELATDEGYYTGYEVGADEIRIRSVYEGTLYYNNGTSENPEWIEYWNYVYDYNDYSEYFPIQDAIDGKFAYSGEEVSLRVRFYTDGDYESNVYPYVEASGENAISEIATQTGEVALDGSGYIWIRYDNNDNGGNDGDDQAWINNLHLIDPSGLATIEVVGQKVIKDGVAHEQELSSTSGSLNLDGIAVKNTPLITNNTNTLIAITTGGNKISFDITDTNGDNKEVNISKAGSTTLTALNVTDAEKIVYGEYSDKNIEDTDTISIVSGNLSSLASNTKIIEPYALHTVSLESLVNLFDLQSNYMGINGYTIDDIVYVNFDGWSTNQDSDELYFNKGTSQNPQWEVFGGGNILAQDIIDGKLAYTGEYLEIQYPEFSFDENWDNYYYYDDYGTMYNPTNTVSLEDLSRAFSVSVDEIASINITSFSVDNNVYINNGTKENPQWIEFWNYYYDNNATYPTFTAQDIIDGKLAYTGNYVNFYNTTIYSAEDVYAKNIYNQDINNSGSDYIYDQTQTHTLTLADLEKAFDIKAGDIDYINPYYAYADNDIYVNIGTKDAAQWVNFNNYFEGDCELTVQDILDGKVIYTGDYLQIEGIYIYDKNGDYLVNDESAYIDNSLNVITLEDIATMYGNNFSADEIGTVYINDWYVDNDLMYNYGTQENPNWNPYYYDYPTLTAQDIIDGKLAYTGDYLQLYTYIRDVNDNYLVNYDWGDYIYPTAEVKNQNTFETIEIYDATDGSLVGDEPYFMHSIGNFEIDANDTASMLDTLITLDGELLTFTSNGDLSDRTITITGYVSGSEDLVTETLSASANGTVVSVNRFTSVTSINLSTGLNEASLSIGKSVVFENTMTLFAKSNIADVDGEITITGLDANGQIQTVVYENILEGISKSVGVFKEVFVIETANMNDGKIEFSAVEGDGFTDILLTGTKDEDGYIVFTEAQRITITNNDSNEQNQEFRITGLDEDGNVVVEIVEGLDSNGSYVSTHYFSKLLNVESGLLNGSSISNISVGTVGAPIVNEQVMSQYGSEIAVNDSVAIFDTPSQITFSSDDNLTSRVFTITGTNTLGETIVENVTGANGGIALSSQKFMTVTSITVDEGTVGSVKVGFTTSGGLTDNFVVTGSGTVEDPFVGYSTNKAEGTESDVLLFVNFNGASAGTVKLSYDLAVQGSVNEDTLYVEYSSNILSLLQGKAYFEDGDSETTILIPVVGDDTKEANEDMTLVLTGSSTGTTIVNDERTTEITIVNDDDLVTLDSTPVLLKEGDDSQTPNTLRFKVTRDASNTEKEVFWHIENITSEDNDFASITGSVIFAEGELETYIDVVLTSDRIQEDTESFNLVLSEPLVGSGYSLSGTSSSTGTIVEDDVAVRIVANNVSQAEGATAEETTYTFTVTRSGDTTQASSIVWNVSGDVANIPYGFDVTTGTLNFAADEIEKTITIKTTGNNEMDGDRPFTVTLTNANGDTSDIKVATATSTMIEDDAMNLSIASTEIKQIEATGTTKTFTYTITRPDAESSYEASYNWSVILEGDGVNPVASAEDFANSTIPSGNIVFAAGSKTATVTFEVANDSLLEADEAFKLRFEAANASNVDAQDITAYIVNDTVAYSIEVKADDVLVDTAVKEGDTENKTITVTFVRAGNSESEATLTYSIEGTTTNIITVNDFVDMQTLPTNETITFAAGQSIVTKTFTLKADSLKEESESFKVVLNSGNTEVATKTVEVTNDDAGLVLEVSQGTLAEGTHAANASSDAQYTTLTYTVYRSGDTTHSSTVSWKVNAESGITMADFVGATDSLGTNNGLPSGTITFDANDLATSKTFTINVKKDWKYEGVSENLVVELFDASAGTGITTATATTIITDDDKEVGFSVTTQTVTEGSPTGTEMVNGTEYVDITYTVLRIGNDRDGTQTITWTLSGLDKEGYDAAGIDSYSIYYGWSNNDVVALDSNGNKATSGTLVFSGNEDNSKTITIRVHKDHYQENPEAFKITLSNPTEGLSISETAGVTEGLITDDDIALSLTPESATRVVHSEGQLDENEAVVYTEYTWVIERTGLEAAVDLVWSIQGNSSINAWYSDRYSSDGYGWSNGWIPSASADTSDFVASSDLSGTLHFDANETSKTLTIRVVGDAVVESTEAFKVVFTKPSNVGDISGLGIWSVGSPTTSNVEGIILRDEGRFGIVNAELDINSIASFDNDEYDTLDVSNAKAEGDDGYVSHFFKIYRDFTTSGDATIEWRVEEGVVSGVSDVSPFLDHNTSTSADENDFVDGQNTLADTTLPSGVATILDGEEYTIIEIKTKGDISAEDLNSFVVRLSNPSSGSTLDVHSQASMGYIANDDHPLFSIGLIVPDEDVSATYGSKVVTEGDTVTYRVYRSGSTAYEADIDWAVTFPNSVVNALNSDYKADLSDFDSLLSGTLNFGVGESYKEITLNIKDDVIKEAWAEAFSIELSNARWASNVPQNIQESKIPAISEVAGKMESIIVDNEEAASIVSVTALNNATDGYEGGLGGTNTITYTLTRTGDTTTAAQIGWTLRTPSDYNDYSSISGDTVAQTYTPYAASAPSYAVGLVSFEAGQTTKTITLTYNADTYIENNENFVFTLIDGKTILENGWSEWMAPWYYGTGNDTTSNANNSGIYLLDGDGKIPDSANMYIDSENSTVTTEVKNDDGKIYVNNTYYSFPNSYMGEHIYEGDSGDIIFTADISRYGRIDHDVTVTYNLVDSNNNVVATGTWELLGDDTNTNGNGSKTYTKDFVLGTGNTTVEADKTYTLKLSNVSDSNILFSQNVSSGSGSTTQDVPVTVLNDDTTWSIGATTTSQLESDDFQTYTFTITRPGNEYVGSATVTYQIIAKGEGYTIDANDIIGGLGERTVSFAAGQTSQVVEFRVAGDRLAERNESFDVELVRANHGVISESSNSVTYTIVNDDTTVEIHNATSTLEEDENGDAYLEFDVVRKGQISNGSSSVTWTVQDGSATITDDLTTDPTAGSLSFDAASTNVTTTVVDGYGEQTQTVRVYIKGDTTVEAHQSLSVSLSNATDSDGIVTGKNVATGTILNDESIFTLTAGESVVEGDIIGQKFTITRSAVTGQPQTIDWAVSSENNSHSVSSDDMDGGLLTGSVTFAPDELVKEIFVKSTVDTVAELDEVFKFTISVANGTTGVTIAANSDVAYGKVLNDDAGTPVVSVNDSFIAIDANSSVVEGDTATSYVAFTLTRSGELKYDAKVSWHIELIDAEANLADFGGTLPSGILELPLGETTFTINIPISGDSSYEANEKFKLVIDAPEPGLTITVDNAEGTITNDDALISIVDNVVINENGTATFTLSRTGVLTESNTVTWTITPSGNVLGTNDISNLTGTATFAADSATTTVTVYLNDDSISEADEVFNFTLSNPSEGASLDVDNSSKTLTITNDDADKITYTVTPLSQVEADGDGWTTYTVIVSRENPTTTVSVDWSVTETTALNLSDIIFEAQTGTVTFEGTSLTATFDIKVKTDDIGDFDKYFDLNLSNPIVKINDVVDSVNGAYVDTNTTELEVLNDDPAFRVDFTANSFVEGSGTNTKLVTFTITRSGDLSGTASLDWAISTEENSFNPVNISDFGGYWPTGTTVFADGESVKTIQVAIAPDAVFEPSESFKVEISNLVSQTAGAEIIVNSDTAVITNDDIGVSVEASVDSINEGTGEENTNVTFTLSAQGVANKTMTTYFVIEGTDLSPIDEFDGEVNMNSFSSNYGNSDYFSYGYDEEKQSFYVQMKTDSDGYAESTFDYGIFADNIAGANETLRVRITEVVGGTADNSETTVEIVNDDTAITSIVNTTVDIKEGNDGTKTYTFEVTRSGSTISSAQVAYEILGFGDNQADSFDFSGQLSGNITFTEGSSTAIIEVVVSSDTVFESDEGFIVVVAPNTPNEARLDAVIKNDDLATLELNGIVTSVKEGTENSNFLTYEIVRNGDNSEPLTVHYKLVDLQDTDIQTADYLANGATGTITIPAGESRVVLALETVNDAISGNDIEFKLQISADGFVNPTAVNSKIVDDDSGISIVAPEIVANVDGTITYTFEVNRTGNLAATTVAWTLAGLGINATASDDFTSEMDGNVEFLENETSKQIVITVAADSIVENDENFRVTLVSSSDSTQKIVVSSADAIIEDDDVISENADIIQGGAGVDVIDSLGGNDEIHSGNGADVIHAGNGNDTIYTESGADTVYAGAGDDNIVVDSLDFMLIDGGLGFDTLTLAGANMVLDFASITAGEKVKSIEAIDLTGNGDNTLRLSFDDVFAINESRELYVMRDAGDEVDLGVLPNGTISSTTNISDISYDVYEYYNAEDEYAKILVQQVTVI